MALVLTHRRWTLIRDLPSIQTLGLIYGLLPALALGLACELGGCLAWIQSPLR